ncbi:hypothetical protein HHK36_032850 [Tetracentron sinense]|uniref:Uncharacterized protein n=1 Tax=Tetracentron sinense TaxID=13715 RepID=A0A834Y4U9_TETSI|nr:hypothetical protein HHK36_032850 [Tetracentron sinense]
MATGNFSSIVKLLTAVIIIVTLLLTSVHHKIDYILSTFFWGVSAGHPKQKWRSWSHLCKPTNEGGLNLRNSLEVQRALHMKFAWRLMSGDSLWNKFFQAKYVNKGHVALASDNDSRFWKSVMGVLPEVLENVRLMVKEGKGSFWYDRWLSSGPLSLHPNVDITPSLCIKDLWVENSWDRDKLVELVGSVKTEEIVQTIAAGRNGEDVLVWKVFFSLSMRSCKARMEGIQETVEGVWLAVKACLRNISGCMKNHGEVSSVDMAMLAALEPKPWIKMLLNGNTVKGHVRILGTATKLVLQGDFLMVVNVLNQVPGRLLLVVVVVD